MGKEKERGSKEETLHEAIMAAINSVVEYQGEFVQAFRKNVIRIFGRLLFGI